MKIDGFSHKKNWYRGNLHSHTVVSDGKLTPAQAVELYKANGYSFLSFSEHDIYTDYGDEFNSDDFILIPSIESSGTLYKTKIEDWDYQENPYSRHLGRIKHHHLHGIKGTSEMLKNAKKPIFEHMEKLPQWQYFGDWYGAKVAQEMADTLAEHGMITTYNHPVWSRVEQEEFENVKGPVMLEIFNFNTVQESQTGYNITYWDNMLRKGKKINAFASDDNHNEGVFRDHCGGWICVNADNLTHDEIITEIINGNYYSSSGPEIYDWSVEDGKAYVKCSDVNSITFVAGNVINDGWTFHGTDFEDDLSNAEYQLKGDEKYIRVECTDKYGRTAWSNPIYFD